MLCTRLNTCIRVNCRCVRSHVYETSHDVTLKRVLSYICEYKHVYEILIYVLRNTYTKKPCVRIRVTKRVYKIYIFVYVLLNVYTTSIFLYMCYETRLHFILFLYYLKYYIMFIL